MSRAQLATLAAIFVLGCALVFFARDIASFVVTPFLGAADTAPSPVLGEFEELNGPVYLKPKSATKSIRPSVRLPLKHLDEVRTESTGQTLIRLKNNWVVLITENSAVIFESYRPEQTQGPFLMSIVRGQYSIISNGRPGGLFIQQNNKLFSAHVPTSNNPRVVTLPTTATTTPTTTPAPAPEPLPSTAPVTTEAINSAPSSPAAAEPTDTLTTAYIESVLSQQAATFRRCQMSSLRDNRPSVGDLLISLTIDSSGDVQDVRLLDDKLKNEVLNQCVISTIQRVKFKAFEGIPITLSYPIQFR